MLKWEILIRKLVFSCLFNKFIDDYCIVCFLNNCKVVWNFDVFCEGKWCLNIFNIKLFVGLNYMYFSYRMLEFYKWEGNLKKNEYVIDIKSRIFSKIYKLYCLIEIYIF